MPPWNCSLLTCFFKSRVNRVNLLVRQLSLNLAFLLLVPIQLQLSPMISEYVLQIPLQDTRSRFNRCLLLSPIFHLKRELPILPFLPNNLIIHTPISRLCLSSNLLLFLLQRQFISHQKYQLQLVITMFSVRCVVTELQSM